MNKTHWTRILLATMLLGVLGGCVTMDQRPGTTQEQESEIGG